MPRAYYNEFDKDAAAWLRALIAAGLIMDGDVDERSIVDVSAGDLRGYTRHHFFAGIGGWDLALQLAGWPADRPVCTASLPCQPFSSAGKRQGVKDERHLWPVFAKLVSECGFPTIIGEQVEAAIKLGWLDGVFLDLERLNYACAAACLPAACVGAPHIRQRLYWVADAARSDYSNIACEDEDKWFINPVDRLGLPFKFGRNGATSGRAGLADDGGNGGLGDTGGAGREGHRPELPRRGGEQQLAEPGGEPCGLEHARSSRADILASGVRPQYNPSCESGPISPWSDTILIPCRDGKARRIGRGISPLAHGLPRTLAEIMPRLAELGHDAKAAGQILKEARRHRVVALKGAGNAIVPPLAAEFIMAFMDAE